MTMTNEEKQADGSMRVPRFSASDILKIAGVVLFILLAWARVESAIDSITRRLDHIEISQADYVRADVATAREQTLSYKLDGVAARLERIESKLDK